VLEKFEEIEQKFYSIERKISDPEIIANQTAYQELIKKHAELKDCVEKFQSFKQKEIELSEAKELLKDPEMKDMAEQEIQSLEKELKTLQEQLQFFLIPKDPNDAKNAIIEIRSGTGGEEAALFAHTLFRMYSKYAESNKWKIEILSENLTGIGGLKEIAFVISGKGVFSRLKFESGTHRVQRVPETESSGRIHTSAATVAILPEAEEVDVTIETKDLRVDTYRASGAGGQHVNKTSSAVRLTHLPTGVVVACQDERSQFQNKDKALRLLRSRLFEIQTEEKQKSEASARKSQVGSGDRSEKIRTYNFPQGRVTDHRINLTLYSLAEILNGKIDEIIDALISADRLAKLQQ
jgi:peptide chain release factor 1